MEERDPVGVMQAILNVVPEEMKAPLFEGTVKTLNDFRYTAPELYSNRWRQLANNLQSVMETAGIEPETAPDWYQTTVDIFNGTVDYRDYLED